MRNDIFYAVERRHRKKQISLYRGIQSGNLYTEDEIWNTHLVTPGTEKFNRLFEYAGHEEEVKND